MYPSQRPQPEHGSAHYPPQNSRSPTLPPSSRHPQPQSQPYPHAHAVSGMAPLGGPSRSPLLGRGRPASPPGHRPLPSPTASGHERQSSGYYDPIMEARRPYVESARPQHASQRSPLQVCHSSFKSCSNMLTSNADATSTICHP